MLCDRPTEAPLAAVVGGFLRIATQQRSWTRLLAWQGLTEPDEAPQQPDPYFEAMVVHVRRRQADGEIAADLDPAYVLLVMFAAAMAPTVIPHVVRRITGRAPDSPEFLDEYADQLRRITDHLAADAPPAADRPARPSAGV